MEAKLSLLKLIGCIECITNQISEYVMQKHETKSVLKQ